MVFDNLLRDVESETGAALGLLGCEIGIEDSRKLRCWNPSSIVFHPKIDIEIFLGAVHGDDSAFIGTRLNRVNDHVLDRPIQLQ